MSTYELLRKRLNALGGSQEGRMKKQKLDSLKKALLYSEQAETIVKDGVEYRAILNKNKQKIDYDDKNISIPFDAGFKVGDIFHWVQEDTDWIVYLKEGQDAYFTGICRRAMYTLKWKDELGIIREVKGAVRGPVETKINSEMKSNISFDSPNYTLYLIIPNNDLTKNLKRYSKVFIGEKMWEVTVTDSLSEPGIIELQLLENYINREEDKDFVDMEEDTFKNLEIVCSLDNIDTLEKDEPFKLWVKVEKDGVSQDRLIENAKFIVDLSKASLSDNIITPIVADNLMISLEIDDIKYKKDFLINVVDLTLAPSILYDINGEEKVKSFGESVYSIEYYVDGLKSSPHNGDWKVVPNKQLFTITSASPSSITFKWQIGSHGTVILQYAVDDIVVVEKKIEVESLI